MTDNKKKNRISTTIIMIVYIWVILWTSNLRDKGTKIALIGGVIIILILMLKNKWKITFQSLRLGYLILGFGFVYSIILNKYFNYPIFRGYREVLIPIILFITGYYLVYCIKTYDYKQIVIKNILIIIGFTLFCYGMINLIVHFKKVGSLSYYHREIYDIWTNNLIAATTQGTKFTLISALFAPIFLADSKYYNRSFKIIVYVCLILSIGATLIMGNRTLIAIIFIDIIICIIIFFKLNNKNLKNIIKKISSIILVIFIISVTYSTNIFNIKTFVKGSNFYTRITIKSESSIEEESRVIAWKDTIKGAFLYPMGGEKTEIKISAPHNLWLDVLYSTGVIPFSILIYITILYIVKIFRIIKSYRINKDFKILIISYNIALFLNCMVEPILGGHYILFMILMFLFGLISGLDDSNCIKEVNLNINLNKF